MRGGRRRETAAGGVDGARAELTETGADERGFFLAGVRLWVATRGASERGAYIHMTRRTRAAFAQFGAPGPDIRVCAGGARPMLTPLQPL
jgi:hypothetical protein